MSLNIWIGLFLALQTIQTDDVPAFVREGDRVEQEFRLYREQLTTFFNTLRVAAERDDNRPLNPPPPLLSELREAPPRPVSYGYQLVPNLIDETPDNPGAGPEQRNYSWPLTKTYIDGERVKLDWAIHDFKLATESREDERRELLRKLIRDYRTLVTNQKTIDQYIQYNRFWQKSIALDRRRFDIMTEVYNLLQEKNPDLNKVISDTLGKPAVPAFIKVDTSTEGEVVLRVPLYSDIEDEAFLTKAKALIEDFWRVEDGDKKYRVEIELKKTSASNLYGEGPVPEPGARFEIKSHTGRFPSDGAVLTTGAQSTHSSVGRYIALGKGDVGNRTLAHEFGHVLGFQDGYVRGYKDLGKDGFEILEITPRFDDLMSAPRQGDVQVTHFKLVIANLPSN